MWNLTFKRACCNSLFVTLCLPVLLFSTSLEAARLYSWIDGEGVQHLSSTPPKHKVHDLKMHRVKGAGSSTAPVASKTKQTTAKVAVTAPRTAAVKPAHKARAHKRHSLRGDPDIEAYMQALRKKQSAELFRLIDSGARPDHEVLSYAVASGQSEIVAALLDLRNADGSLFFSKGVNYRNSFESLLTTAIRRGHEKLVTLLLQKGARPSNGTDDRHSDLEYAISRKHSRMVSQLIAAGADVQANHSRAIQLAQKQNNNKISLLLLAASAEQNVVKAETDDADLQTELIADSMKQGVKIADLSQQPTELETDSLFAPLYGEIEVLK
ncbi:MAG: ankyrin repeat domain-containing protein [gamma proteobacterium symbiont of Bathyaustriella thionipta]|nr:ankyrin repeat domain-containing protein [gamma proteobacterium symbiont of Bathyaustriella thionipta]